MRSPYPPHGQCILVISGPSGVGKDSVVRRLRERDSSLYFVVTCTTRAPRRGEVEGEDYFFVSTKRFSEMIEEDLLLEYALVYGDYKGVLRTQVTEALDTGKDIVMRLDVQGAASIKVVYPEAVLIFLTTHSVEELARRLRVRKSETLPSMKARFDTAREEMEHVNEFDHCIVNAQDRLDDTVDAVLAVLDAEHHRF